MTETIAQKVNKLSIFSGDPTGTSPSNRDYIRNLNYRELEEQYQIHKYYPSDIHNEISTPTLKSQLEDTPIYAKANKNVKRNCKIAASKIIEHANPYQKSTKMDSRHHEVLHDLVPVAARRYGSDSKHTDWKNEIKHGKHDSATHVHQSELVFHDPFDDMKIVHKPSGHKSSKRQNSIASRVLNFVRGDISQKQDKTQIGIPLRRSTSFDQTKSNMTSSRKKKSIFPKLKQGPEPRRGSEQLRKYFIN